MYKKIFRFTFLLSFLTISVISICHLPALIFKDVPPPEAKSWMGIQNKTGFFPVHFLQEIKQTLLALFHWDDITYIAKGTDAERTIFPYILESYTYSLTLLFVSLFIAFLFAVAFTTATFYLPLKIQIIMKQVLSILEALPDVFVIFSLQLMAVWIFQNTDLPLAEPYAISGEKIYLLPILTLSLIPMIYLFKNTLLMYENELGKPYVELGVAKGLGKMYILMRHVFPNVLFSFFYNLKYIYLLMISNLIILEYMYNIYGLLQFMTAHPTYEIITAGVLLLTIPFSIVFFLIQSMLPKGVDFYDQTAV